MRRQQRLTTGAAIRSHVGEHLSHLEELGVGDAFAEVRAAWAHAEELRTARLTPDDVRALEQRVGAQLAAGDIGIEDAVQEVMAAQLRGDESSAAARVLAWASGHEFRRALALLADPCDRWIEDVLRPAVEKVVDEFAELVEKLPADVVDDATAVQAGAKHAATWTQCVHLAARFAAFHYRAMRMRDDAILGASDYVEDDTVDGSPHYRFRDPLAAPASRGQHPVIALRDAIRAGAGPTLLTAPEVNGREGARDRDRRAEQAHRQARPFREKAQVW